MWYIDSMLFLFNSKGRIMKTVIKIVEYGLLAMLLIITTIAMYILHLYITYLL